MLCDLLVDEELGGRRVLELCVGSGFISVAAARAGARTTAIDISRLAARTTQFNAWRAGVPVEVHRGDLYEPVQGRRFDLIVANPPYVPTTNRRLPRFAPSKAWDGGPGGRAVLDRIIDGLPYHLRPGGRALLLHSSLNDDGLTIEALEANSLRVADAHRHTGPLGPLMTRQVARGTVSADHEDVVVIDAIWDGPGR